MPLLELLFVVYVGVTLYSTFALGNAPIVAACWPLVTATKVLIWVAKQDPAIAATLNAWAARIDALEHQVIAIQKQSGGTAPTPNPQPPQPAPNPPAS